MFRNCSFGSFHSLLIKTPLIYHVSYKIMNQFSRSASAVCFCGVQLHFSLRTISREIYRTKPAFGPTNFSKFKENPAELSRRLLIPVRPPARLSDGRPRRALRAARPELLVLSPSGSLGRAAQLLSIIAVRPRRHARAIASLHAVLVSRYALPPYLHRQTPAGSVSGWSVVPVRPAVPYVPLWFPILRIAGHSIDE